ncbi:MULTISPECIES: DUF2752 domain-containing protein [Kitasatospora]|uniref:DUF2752 domain-containing protein n=2 Tax=Kitasatospora TaxID=2063 RepID=A0ABT1IXM8_9ACTN|nr:DUF2752 domain-containing protein [Kitasatospora paracochleata]MCP2309900.1 hypothetical protein [Kitasatospora paracochleata]
MSTGGAVAARLTDRWRRSADSLQGALLRVLLRGAGGAVAAVAVAELHDAHDPGVLCVLRRFTGIPCPGCGSTTVFIEAGHGNWTAALAANPVTVVAAVGLLIAPLGPGRWWWGLSNGRRNALIGAALLVSWTWQLHRLGISRP